MMGAWARVMPDSGSSGDATLPDDGAFTLTIQLDANECAWRELLRSS